MAGGWWWRLSWEWDWRIGKWWSQQNHMVTIQLVVSSQVHVYHSSTFHKEQCQRKFPFRHMFSQSKRLGLFSGYYGLGRLGDREAQHTPLIRMMSQRHLLSSSNLSKLRETKVIPWKGYKTTVSSLNTCFPSRWGWNCPVRIKINISTIWWLFTPLINCLSDYHCTTIQFQTWILFSIIWDVILPIDELHHFSRWLLHRLPLITIFLKFLNQIIINHH